MTDPLLLRYAPQSGLLSHWSGTRQSLQTEEEEKVIRDLVSDKLISERVNYENYFTAMRKCDCPVDGEQFNDTVATAAQMDTKPEWSPDGNVTVNAETLLSLKKSENVPEILVTRGRKIWGSRAPITGLSFKSGLQYSLIGAAAIDSEPSTYKVHTHNVEPNATNTPWSYGEYDSLHTTGVLTQGLNVRLDGKLFLNGVRVDVPREIQSSSISGLIEYPCDLRVLFAAVSSAWSALDETLMNNAAFDARKDFNELYQSLSRSVIFNTANGDLILSILEIIKAVNSQTSGWNVGQTVDLSNVPKWHVKRRLIDGTLVPDFSEYTDIGYGGKAPDENYYASLQRISGSGLSMMRANVYYVDESSPPFFSPGYSLLSSPSAVQCNPSPGNVIPAARVLLSLTIPGVGNDGDIKYESVGYTPADWYETVTTVYVNTLTTFGVYRHPREWSTLNAICSFNLGSSYFSTGRGTQWYANAGGGYLNPSFVRDGDTSEVCGPRGASRAVVCVPGQEIVVHPGVGDYISASVWSSKSEDGPTVSVQSTGVVFFHTGNNQDYSVDILELNNGFFVQRLPVYRSPERMLSAPRGKMDYFSAFDRFGGVRTVTPSITGRLVTADLPQGYRIFVSKISRWLEPIITLNVDGQPTVFALDVYPYRPYPYDTAEIRISRTLTSLVHESAEEIPDGIIPDRYTGTVYVQVVDTYYCEMQEITVNL